MSIAAAQGRAKQGVSLLHVRDLGTEFFGTRGPNAASYEELGRLWRLKLWCAGHLGWLLAVAATAVQSIDSSVLWTGRGP